MSSFEDLDSQAHKPNEKPIWTIDIKDDEAVLKWLNSELKFLEQKNEDRIRGIKHNIARYKGVQYLSQDTRSANRDREVERSKFSPKIVVNLLALTTEMRVSKMAKFRPGVQILPTNDEYQDKLSAKIAKNVDDHIAYTQQAEAKIQQAVRLADIAGEGYIDTTWNEDLGENHPDWSEDEKINLLDEKGEKVLDEKGEEKFIEQPVKIGDVAHSIILPHYIMLEEADSYELSDYAFIMEPVLTEKLKKDHPKMADKLKSDKDKQIFNLSTLEDENLVNRSMKITFVHKKTKYMPKGAHITFTRDCLLENEPHKYDHGDFTFERLPGVEVPGEQYALSRYENLKALATQFNNLTNMMIRQIALGAHPKWFVPKGSVKLDALGNDFSIAQYQGAQPPVLAQGNPVSPQVFELRGGIKNEIMELGKVGDVMRGDPPPGIKSGVALQFLAEQESQQSNADIANFNEFIKRLSRKRLSVASQFYDKGDKRTMLVLGQNKHWVAENFDPKHLDKAFDVRLQNSSALPDSKAARTQYILDIAERFPTLFPPEQVTEMLDLGQADKFMTDSAAAIRSAEYENENILDSKEVTDPEEYENHLLHWTVHFKALQDPTFKKMPEEIKQNLKDHMMATEMLMEKKAMANPAFAMQLQALPMYPVLWTPSAPPMMGAPAPGAEMPPPMAGDPAMAEGMMQDPAMMPPAEEQMEMQALPQVELPQEPII